MNISFLLDDKKLPIEVIVVETKPYADPYHLDTHLPTKTVFWFSPEDRKCGVEQEYNTNSTSFKRFNNLELTWHIDSYPKENDMCAILFDIEPYLQRIVAGFSTEYRNGNLVGIYNDDAYSAILELNDFFVDYYDPLYEWHTVEDYFHPVLHDLKSTQTREDLERQIRLVTPEFYQIFDRNYEQYLIEKWEQFQIEMEEA